MNCLDLMFSQANPAVDSHEFFILKSILSVLLYTLIFIRSSFYGNLTPRLFIHKKTGLLFVEVPNKECAKLNEKASTFL